MFALFASCLIAQPSKAVGITTGDTTVKSTHHVSMPAAHCQAGLAADFASFAQKSLHVTFAGTSLVFAGVSIYQLFKVFQNWWREKNDPSENSARLVKAFLSLGVAAGCAGLTAYNFADIWSPTKQVSEMRRTISHQGF
jgi:hypothetical protein